MEIFLIIVVKIVISLFLIVLVYLCSIVTSISRSLELNFPHNIIWQIKKSYYIYNMGGNALTEPTRRCNRAEYVRIRDYIVGVLNSLSIETIVPRELSWKESFGDIDILYIGTLPESLHKSSTTCLTLKSSTTCSTLKSSTIKSSTQGEILIGEILGEIYTDLVYPFRLPTRQIVINNTTTTIEYDNVQIDLHKVIPEYAENCKIYFYSDIGGMIGYIASYYNLSYGEFGLWTYIYNEALDKTTAGEKVFLSSDPRRILEFFGLSYERFEQDFQKPEELFDWIMSSRLFKKEIFSVLNCTNKKRYARRPLYTQFIDHCVTKHDCVDPKLTPLLGDRVNAAELEDFNVEHNGLSKHDVYAQALAFFENDYHAIKARADRSQQIAKKFNGHLFIRAGIDKRLITQYKNQFIADMPDFEEWVLSSQNIEDVVREYCKQKLPMSSASKSSRLAASSLSKVSE